VIDPLDLLRNGPDNERVFETSTIVYTDGCDRYLLRTSRHCDDKPLEVLTGLLPGLLAAAQEKVADKERQPYGKNLLDIQLFWPRDPGKSRIRWP